MKHLSIIITAIFLSGLLSSCGVGSYTISSGKADVAGICFISAEKHDINVEIDGKKHDMETVKNKKYHKSRNIKKTAHNTLQVSPGKHSVKVWYNGNEIYSKLIFVSSSETKIIEL